MIEEYLPTDEDQLNEELEKLVVVVINEKDLFVCYLSLSNLYVKIEQFGISMVYQFGPFFRHSLPN